MTSNERRARLRLLRRRNRIRLGQPLRRPSEPKPRTHDEEEIDDSPDLELVGLTE